jgi:hypothetical protein
MSMTYECHVVRTQCKNFAHRVIARSYIVKSNILKSTSIENANIKQHSYINVAIVGWSFSLSWLVCWV